MFKCYNIETLKYWNIESQATNPVLLLQPDRAVSPNLLHGHPRVHSPTGLWREARPWWEQKRFNLWIYSSLEGHISRIENSIFSIIRSDNHACDHNIRNDRWRYAAGDRLHPLDRWGCSWLKVKFIVMNASTNRISCCCQHLSLLAVITHLI